MKNRYLLQNTRGAGLKSALGFTLIELLVVIAIIAILAAIIFPVFSTLQENARQNNTIEHMHDISAGLALYKLDNKNYPPVLFAYACDGRNGDGCKTGDTMATIAGDASAKSELVGLYPEYVRDWHAFTCADDTVNDPGGALTTMSVGDPQPNVIEPQATGFSLVAATGTQKRSYYLGDAFDVGPVVASNNTLDTSDSPFLYTIRYQTAWTSYDPNYVSTATDGAPFWADYQRQLLWRNPPANTYVTGVTYHIQSANRLMVLYESGTAKSVVYQAANGQPDVGWDDSTESTITPTTTSTMGSAGTTSVQYVPVGFWRYDATGR